MCLGYVKYFMGISAANIAALFLDKSIFVVGKKKKGVLGHFVRK